MAEEWIGEVKPDAEGVRMPPVSPVNISIRLWTAGPPKAPTDWFIFIGEFPRPAQRFRIQGRHRQIFNTTRDEVFLAAKRTLIEFVGNKSGHLGIVVPQSVIDEL